MFCIPQRNFTFFINHKKAARSAFKINLLAKQNCLIINID